MKAMEFAEAIVKMPVEMQNEFFAKLKKELSYEEWKATAEFIGVYNMFKHPAKLEAIKNAICDQLCEEFYGHTVEKKNNVEDPCNPIYMTTIL